MIVTKERISKKGYRAMVGGDDAMANCFLLLACLLFSFACNLIKKLYDDKDYSTVFEMLKSAAVSGIAGFIFAMILSEFLSSPLLVVSMSGIGGFFGTKALNALIKTNISTKLTATEALQELLAETSTDDHEGSRQLDLSRARPAENNDNPKNTSEDGASKHFRIHVIRRDE